MKLYRIYTEDTGPEGRKAVNSIMASRLPGFTIISAMGYWNGFPEFSLVIEVLGEEFDRPIIWEAAQEIRLANKQKAVLVVSSTVELQTIRG